MNARTIVLSSLGFLFSGILHAQVFQYSIPLPANKGEGAAFLWIPAQAERIRGLIIGGMTLAERELVKDPLIRAACTEQALGLLLLKGGNAELPKILGDFAEISGYSELTHAPLFFVGHSAGGPPAKNNAVRYAERCFGLMQYRGGTPVGNEPVPPGIPCLTMVGQFDEFGGVMRTEDGREPWHGARNDIEQYRSADPGNLGSILVEPGAGHFAWSERSAAILALYIAKAAARMIPAGPQEQIEPVKLIRIAPESGWLTDLNLKKPEHAAAAYKDYQGDKTKAAWNFDREMAEASMVYHRGLDKKDQFIAWKDSYWVDAGTRYFFTNLKWVGDGQTFQVQPVFMTSYPQPQKSGGPRWLQAGENCGHAVTPIKIKHCSGPIVVNSPDTFRMQYDTLAPATEGARVTFMAYNEGDETYRYTEQVGMMPRGFNGLNKGREQKITFPELTALKSDSRPVALNATSDAGTKIEYYIGYGPAIIDQGQLVLSEIPKRAKFPIQIKVVAYQFGSGVEPLIKTALPVEHTVTVHR